MKTKTLNEMFPVDCWRAMRAAGGLILLGALPHPIAAVESDDLLLDAPTPAEHGKASSTETDDLLLDGPAPAHSVKATVAKVPAMTAAEASAAHGKLFLEKRFPSATTCGVCHPDHFREWSVSSHAYAQLSPVFNAMMATIVKETSGTNGDFCIRCHTQVGMQLKEPVHMTNLDRDPASREGITCIVCHRISQPYGKVSGRTSIVEGDVFEPVYGPTGNANLKQVIAQAADYKVVTERGKPGRGIHGDAIKFETISTSAFCGQCHDVNLLNGFRLEEAFSQFKNSPANKAGTTCQDCHMGVVPGLKSGYANAPAANIGGKTTPSRKRTNHMFAGPDYSVVHPGIFPHSGKAQELASLREWLEFDYDSGWGTDEFEKKVPEDAKFPERWKSVDDRYDARAILAGQFGVLDAIKAQRYQILRRGYQLGDLVMLKNDSRGLSFKVQVRNGTDGHGVSTGFDAERLSFLQVTVTDADGHVVFRSGDRDPNGDVRDIHSAYVHNDELPLDHQLFSLQSKFLTRNLRGGEREQVLAVNYSVDPLPYIRPDTTPGVLIARPGGVRKQARILPPLGARFAEYQVPARNLTGRAPYTLNVRLIAQMVPVNLLREIADVGLDYNLTPRKVADRIVKGSHLLWDRTIELPAAPNTTISLRPTEDEIMAPPPASNKQFEHDRPGKPEVTVLAPPPQAVISSR